MDQPHPSYSRGSQDKTLLAMTIGQAFDHTVAQHPQGEALVVRHQQRRATPGGNWPRRLSCTPAHSSPWVCKPVTAWVSGRLTVPSG